jgi:hypothetical protein
MLRKYSKFNKGQVVMISLLIFLSVSLSTIFAVSLPVIQHVKIARDSYTSKQTFYAAEALNEDILYRLNSSLNVSASESLAVGDSSVEATITDTSEGKEIEVTAENTNIIRKIKSEISTDVGVSFNYGIQVGTGGFDISSNSSVIGNIYVNGNITGAGGAVITGSAVAAAGADAFLDQSNGTTTIPAYDILIRNTSGSQDMSQSFTVSTTSAINKVAFYIKKVGAPASASVRLVSGGASAPSSSDLFTYQGTLNAGLVTTSYGWVEVVLPSNPTLVPGTTYWIIIDNSTHNVSNYYVVGGNQAYMNGFAKVGQNGGTWNNTSPANLDSYFQIYLGASNGSITRTNSSGSITIGTASTDLAWAANVNGVSVTGPLYCQLATYSNKGCDTTRPSPSPLNYPISDSNITEWKDAADDGSIINGNVTIGNQGTTTGPLKINGNLTINGNGTMTLTGPIWVTGNISLTGGGTMALSYSYWSNSGIVVSDGTVNMSGNTNITGSGQSGSYILIVTTSNSTTAMSVSGGAGAVVLNAPNGTISFSGGAAAKSAVAKRITLAGGSTITYENGLQNANFSTGPSGSWTINSWQEIE